eukprot:11018804-Prorocentrum_lima.AAC.1
MKELDRVGGSVAGKKGFGKLSSVEMFVKTIHLLHLLNRNLRDLLRKTRLSHWSGCRTTKKEN